ncbi:hypothetical protein [Caballeronia grimmiae]|uniref:hypothetical protein n=1 Tax=Caballeronia grimmiae TaxID=1071679 RepID=UPI0038BCF482
MTERLSPSHDFKRLSLRLEHIFHIDSMVTQDALPDAVRSALVSDFREVRELLARQQWFPAERCTADVAGLEKAILAATEESNGPFGWLVKARQPHFFVADNREFHWWGARIRTIWLYADTYDAALASAIEWAEAYSQEVWGETEA